MTDLLAGRRLALLPLLALGLTGCPTPYSGQARVPSPRAAGDVGGYVVLGAYLAPEAPLHTGAPRVVDLTEARCVDESLCEVTLRNGLAVVGGKRAGQGDVRLSFVQPSGGEASVQVVSVTFSPRPTRPLAVGPRREESPGAAVVLEQPGQPGPTRYRCYRQHTSSRLDLGDLTRGEAELHACTPGVEVSPGHWYLPSGDAPSAPIGAGAPDRAQQRLACQRVATRSGERTSLAVYRDDVSGQLTPLSYEGAPDAVCSPLK